nr:immunoglobulin heavy chain junction region [Macaca mulatta]MOW20649.1 immunoglobulin heavy chain junction region [Macaca mulatta]MOW22199.1 immunoglobulin heavy chain junction region [Macaca mulatta]MOW22455.1 immunoglobulin heavy chain junction region [Macaca mulatta]
CGRRGYNSGSYQEYVDFW